MIISLQIGSILYWWIGSGVASDWAPTVIPGLYCAVMIPGALWRPMSRRRLTELLEPDWANAQALADYIYKNWPAFLYPALAKRRAVNANVLAVSCLIIGILGAIQNLATFSSVILTMAICLFWLFTRVSRPQLSLDHDDWKDSSNETFRAEWETAALSMVAFSNLSTGSAAHMILRSELMSDPAVQRLVSQHSKSKIAAYTWKVGQPWPGRSNSDIED